MKPPIYNPAWSEEVQSIYHHDVREIWDRSIAPQVWVQYHNQLHIYLSFVSGYKSLNILDVGCAQATLALMLAEMGHVVTAVDLRQEFLDYASTRYEFGDVRFIQGNILEIELKDNYDLIFSNQIIEHLVYPIDMVKKLKNMLNPNGRLVITTPNGDYLMNTLPSYSELGDPQQWEHMQFTADGDGHFFAYTALEINDILSAAGFVSPHVDYFETPFVSGHMKFRMLQPLFPDKLLQWLDRLLIKFPYMAERFSHQLIGTGVNS